MINSMWNLVVIIATVFVLKVSGGSQELPKPDEAKDVLIDWAYYGSSISKNGKGEYVFTVNFTTTSLVDLIWRMDRVPVYEDNKYFSIDMISDQYDNKIATLTAHIPAEKLMQNTIHLTATVSAYKNQTVSVTTRIDTKELHLQNEVSDIRFKYKVNRAWSKESLDEIITVMPMYPNGAETLHNSLAFAFYQYLNDSGNDETFGQVYAVLHSNGETTDNDITIHNVTGNNGPLKTKVSLDYDLMPYDGDLLVIVAFDRNPGLVSDISLFFMLPFVFTDGSPANSNLKGKFAINTERLDFHLSENYPDFIYCEARGYPPPRLYIKRLDNGHTMPFGSGHLRYFPEFHSSIFEVLIPNVEQNMEGDYACVAEDISQGKFQQRTMHVKVMVPAKFDKAATTVKKLSDGSIIVNITATGKHIPDVSCMMNDRYGDEINYSTDGITVDKFSDENRSQTHAYFKFDPAFNGTRYIFYRLECRAGNSFFGSNKDDWMTVKL